MRIACTGSIALDTTRTPFKTMEKTLGGAGVFFSWASSFFASTTLVGAVGKDFPHAHMKALIDKGVELAVEVKDGKTFFVDWTYGSDLNDRKVNDLQLNVLENYLPTVPKSLQNAEFVYAGTCEPFQQLHFIKQFSKPVFTAIDSIMLFVETETQVLEEAINHFDCLFLNEVEAKKLARTESLITAGKALLKKGPSVVVLKKGENGAMLFYKENVLPFPAFPIEDVVDPTGAGDSFAGGFMGSLAREGVITEQTLRKAMAYGQVMGSFCVQDFGLDNLKKLNYPEIQERYVEYKKLLKI